MAENITKIVDLHCDTLTECHEKGLGLDNDCTHFSTSKIPPHMKICQATAVFMPDTLRGDAAWDFFDSVYLFFKNETARLGLYTVSSLSDVCCTLDTAAVSAILTVEGGSVLAGRLENVGRLHERGVKIMTLTWNAENELCGGCATDSGFTGFGRAAVREMEKYGIIADVSHLSDKGFYELCDFAERPFIATHSNSRTICAHRRNLTDDMFVEIKNRGGLVGLNYYDAFIREGGGSENIDDFLKHVHHLLDLGGEDTLALGSDFDGAKMPPYLDSVEKHLHLLERMEKFRISSRIVEKIAYNNAVDFFARY